MRFLCLHGMGTNPEILEAQIAPLRAGLSGHHEFVYLAGEVECDAAPGVSNIYPGPYLSYYTLPTTTQVQDAHDLVLDFIDEEGPFDAVIGFSQGAALASSLMLQRAKDTSAEPLFQLAIFLCASLPFDIDAPPVVVRKAPGGRLRFLDTVKSPDSDSEMSSDSESEDLETEIPQSSAGAQSVIQEFHAQGFNGRLEDGMHMLRRFHPGNYSNQRLGGRKLHMGVPTVNIVGKKDPYFQQGMWLAELGGVWGSVTVDHGGGHEVCREAGAVRKMSRAVQDTVEKVRFQC
ncbi:MAG: hypothetical protein L6R41_006235 [Letrouitia leprolyta]|nr:MAG: hypothetical protein L6R41_006235 [Letrouitia leprolyta]